MHNWARDRTGIAARHQVVHRGSPADAGGGWGAVATLGLNGPPGHPQDPPGRGHGAYVTTDPGRDCRACDGDVAAGGVVGVLGHHRRDRHQRGRGDRHPFLGAQLAQGR